MEMSDRYARMIERGDMTLMKEVAYGSMEAFEELMDRYLDLVSRTSFRIMCDRTDSEYVTARVFVSLWHDVLDYDDSFTLGEWLLRKTCHLCRLRLTRRHILNIFGVVNDVFVNVSPKADDEDDYVTKQAWELHCKVSSHKPCCHQYSNRNQKTARNHIYHTIMPFNKIKGIFQFIYQQRTNNKWNSQSNRIAKKHQYPRNSLSLLRSHH